MGLMDIFFKRNIQQADFPDYDEDEDEDYPREDEYSAYVGVIIHFTPHMTYVYISDDYEPESNSYNSNIELYGEHGNTFEVSGNYLNISKVKREEVDTMLKIYQVAELPVPFIKIPVR